MAGVQGLTRPRWGAGATFHWGGLWGRSPPAENESGYFGDQFAVPQCTEIVKTIFFFCLEVEDQNQHFITFSNIQIFKTTNIYNQTAKVTNLINFLWNTLKSTCAWAMIYQTIRAEMTVLPPKVRNSLSIMKKASWKCCACKICNSIVSKQDLTVVRLTCVQL